MTTDKLSSKATTLIAIKLLIIYILIATVIDAPSTAMYVVELAPRFVMETATQTESYWYVFWMIVVSIILIWVLVYILSWLLKSLIYIILSKEMYHSLVEVTPVKFELTVLSVLGLYFFISGLSFVTYDIWLYQKESTSSFFYGMGLEGFMMIFSYMVEMVVGLILMLFPKKVALFLINIRRDY